MHRVMLPRALPSAAPGGLQLALAPRRAAAAPAEHARAAGGGKRPASKRRKPAPPPLPIYSGDGSEYFIFARKAEERWMPLGDMVVAEDAQPGLVLAQRREALKKEALRKYPTLAQRREDQAFELGWRLQKGRAPEGVSATEVQLAPEAPPAGDTTPLVPARVTILPNDQVMSARLKQAMLADSFMAMQDSSGGRMGFSSKPLS